MKKVSFRVRYFDKEQFLTYNIDDDANLDEEMLDFLEDEEPKGIVPVIFEEDEEDCDTFSYNITDRIHLNELSNQEIPAEMVLRVLRSLVLTLINMTEYRIPLSYLVLHRNYIYVDSDYNIDFVCIPLEEMQEEVDLISFLRNFMASLRFEPAENGDYVAKILTYINNQALFNLRNLVTLVEDLMGDMDIDIPEDSSAEIYAEYQEVDDVLPHSNADDEVDSTVDAHFEGLHGDTTVLSGDSSEDADFFAENEDVFDTAKVASYRAATEEPVVETETPEEEKTTKEETAKKEMTQTSDAVEDEEVLEEDVQKEEEKESDKPVSEEKEDKEPEIKEPEIDDDLELTEEEIAAEREIIENLKKVAAKTTLNEPKISIKAVEEPKKDTSKKEESVKKEEKTDDKGKDKTIKKPVLKTKDTSKGIVIEDELDEFLAEKELEEKKAKHEESGLKIKQNIKINRASIVKSTQEELAAEQKAEDNLEETEVTEVDEDEEVVSNSILSQTIGATGILRGATVPKANPYLIRVNTDERIMVTKQNFKLGKASMGVDYTIKGNGAVSRVHAIITNKDGIYYIKDNKSTNHTYVNNKMIEDGDNELLTHDCKIVLGDEEFIFKLR